MRPYISWAKTRGRAKDTGFRTAPFATVKTIAERGVRKEAKGRGTVKSHKGGSGKVGGKALFSLFLSPCPGGGRGVFVRGGVRP